ncbi:class I SAM-dependent methyltransferase [Phenylobacterium sp.]|uniref:class I SAM-dependent methyltransferase n=1 Tax=Phenylobacterium sp. TaxID=1871053 RepID=UPI0027302A82|nr:methyltransferase domain-containing protein [Phenylobacterium sp.]MDP2215331.1 methyltransferase domain-containing protein [Phenylobacterium sp.]
MRRDILDLRAFYASELGRMARAMVGRKLTETWGDAAGLDVLGLGYPTPYLGAFRPRARRVVAAMPAQQGVEIWPGVGGGLTTLAHEDALPFQNALFDRILVIHALEESPDPTALLREVWRVMAPSGRVIVAVAARDGLWANAESTPFGHGRPYSRRQLAQLIREAEFEPLGYTRALYAPPVSWLSGQAETFEQAGSRLWPRFSGVVLIEAIKQTYAIKARPQRVKSRVARPVMAPIPATRDPARRNPSP